ncbi:MAG: hypothetical protein IJ845_01150 [Bacteroidaceae bacterium]|nr:hypothetical protein [Bacteroidaceae bacterium]
MKDNKYLYFGYLLIIGVVFYLMNVFTPEYLDDYLYKYMFINGKTNTDFPIHTLKDVLLSQYDHYFSFNGRVIVHSFVQLFSGILGKPIFNIVNSFVLILLVYTLTRHYSNKNTSNYLFSFSVIFLLFPIFRDSMLWMTGSINYLWSSAAVCLYLLLFYMIGYERFKLRHLLVGLCCVFLGWSHEGISFPLSLSLVLFAIYHYRSIYRHAAFPMIIGFVLGAFLCTFAPSTMGRASLDGGFSIMTLAHKIVSGLTLCTKLKAFYCLLISVIVVLLFKGANWKCWLKSFIKDNPILWGALVLSFGVVFLSGFTSSRTATTTELFSIILMLKALTHIKENAFKIVKGIVNISCLVIIMFSIRYYFDNNVEYNNLTKQIRDNHSSIILTNEVKMPAIVASYVRLPLEHETSGFFDAFSYNSPWNNYIAKTYQKDSLAFIPESIYKRIISAPEEFDAFCIPTKDPFYIKRIDKENVERVVFALNDANSSDIPFYLRPLANKLERYSAKEIEASLFSIITIADNRYLCVRKNSMVDNRLKEIIVE